MSIALIRWSWLQIVATCLLGWLPAIAAAEPPRFELIYTQPADTELAQPLRAPAPLWAAAFEGASQSIAIEQFYLAEQTGEALDAVLAALEKAARRGVAVRVLVDSKMKKQSQPTLDRLAPWPNTEVRVLDWSKLPTANSRLPGGIIHAKFWIVDGKLGYLGSQNFDWRSLSHIHELGVLIRDNVLSAQLLAIFELDWSAAGLQAKGQPAPPTQPSVRQMADRSQSGYLVASPPERLPAQVGCSEDELVHLIGQATKRLQIQVMKYEPLDHHKHYYAPIEQALRSAAARGVQIELLVSAWNSDAPGIRWLQSLSLVPGIAVKMATLPQAKRGYIAFARVIHSKYMVVDDAVLWIGTSNWQGGYLDESRNVELVVRSAELSAQASALHAQLWASPYSKPLDPVRAYPRVKRD